MPSPTDQLTFRGRTVAEWIEQLAAADPAERSAAADGLAEAAVGLAGLLLRMAAAARLPLAPADMKKFKHGNADALLKLNEGK